MSAYHQGLTGYAAEWAVKKWKWHQQILEVSNRDIQSWAYFTSHISHLAFDHLYKINLRAHLELMSHLIICDKSASSSLPQCHQNHWGKNSFIFTINGNSRHFFMTWESCRIHSKLTWIFVMCRLWLGLKAPALAWLSGLWLVKFMSQAKSQKSGLAWPGFGSGQGFRI